MNVTVDKQHPIEAVPDFKLNKRIESRRKFIDGIYREVEKYTDEKKMSLQMQFRRPVNHGGKRSF